MEQDTGYDHMPACGCKTCPTCKGQGETHIPNGHPLGTRPGEYGPLAMFRCPNCRGTGTDTGDCELPGHDWPEEPVPGGLLAEFQPFVDISPLDLIEIDGGR